VTCAKKGKLEFREFGEHTGTIFQPKQHGMTTKVKGIIEDIIFTNSNQPKHIYIRMHKKRIKSIEI
jgi:hypothetical protein